MSRPLGFRRVSTAMLACALVLSLPAALAAQTRQVQRNPSVTIVTPNDSVDARTTREAFREIMRLHPPALGGLFKLDPTLMSNEAYLTPYPVVAEFLKSHPDIARNPGYYLAYYDGYGNQTEPISAEEETKRQALNMWRNIMDGLMFFMVFVTIVLTLTWVLRYIVTHRRWLRASRVQSEVHGRLMERLSSNEELLAYVQSPAGRAFLQATPIAADAGPSSVAAPFGRILWSVQAGLVIASAGIGLLIIREYVMPEVQEMLLTIGVLGCSLGVGFALAAIASYIISARLGLITDARADGVNRNAPGSV